MRGFLPGFGYQVGVFLSSYVSYGEAVLAKRTGYATAMALTAVVVFAMAALATAFGPERHQAKFGG